jgi:hypothetical protein
MTPSRSGSPLPLAKTSSIVPGGQGLTAEVGMARRLKQKFEERRGEERRGDENRV